MSLTKINFLLLTCIFPVFLLRSNFDLDEILISLMLFILPLFLINFFYLRSFKNNKILINLYLAVIIVIGIDNNLGLWNGLIQPYADYIWSYFGGLYIPTLFFLILIILIIFFLIHLFDYKILNFLFIFLITIFIFNIFDKTKSHKSIIEFNKSNKLVSHNTEIVIVFDEMSGLNSLSSNTQEGKEFNNNLKTFFKNYDFEFYSNIDTFSQSTFISVPNLLNFSKIENAEAEYLKKSNNYFIEYELKKNLFFENYDRISVFQNISIDYCNHSSVFKCQSYNPYKKIEYLDGFKDTYLSKIISIWKLNGSIVSTFVWRILKELNIIDSLVSPEGDKIAFNDLFKNIKKDIYSQKFDLIFIHTLVPHKPYGFDEKCNYNGKLSLNNHKYSETKHIKQHNIERNCVIFYLENFLNDLNDNDFLAKTNLTILSDHGSRINSKINSSKSTIFARKYINSNYKEIKKPSIIQDVFSTKFNN